MACGRGARMSSGGETALPPLLQRGRQWSDTQWRWHASRSLFVLLNSGVEENIRIQKSVLFARELASKRGLHVLDAPRVHLEEQR